jgi:hypothetical protein
MKTQVNLLETLWADQYTDPQLRSQITERYLEIHTPRVTPLTQPLQFDPLNPPQGWRWDPYYELWVEL